MTIKVIQLNFWQGQFLKEAADFLKQENPDIITLQEVSTSIENQCEDKTLDTFAYLKNELELEGVFAPAYAVQGSPESLQGNAVLTKGTITSSHALWLRDFAEVPRAEHERDYVNFPRNALDCTIELNGIRLHALSVHGAWTKDPVDTLEKIRQTHVLAQYIKQLGDQPFVIGGDFNMPPGSEVEKIISSVARNAVTHPPSTISRTTHPTIHKTVSFLPKGIIVDFIFTSSHFTISSIDAPQVTISDHLPIRATFTL